MYCIVTTTQLQIGCSTVSLCRIHVYYGVINVLWAHRSKSIRKLHMHRGLQDIWYCNNMFYKLCVRIDSTNDNQYGTSSINNAIYRRMFPPTQFTRRTLKPGRTEAQLLLWNYKTSCRHLEPPRRFRLYSTLVQTSAVIPWASHMVHAPTTTSSKNEIWSNSQNFNICVESQ